MAKRKSGATHLTYDVARKLIETARTKGLVRLVLCACGALQIVGCSQKSDIDRLQVFLSQQRPPISGVEYRVLPPDVLSFRSAYVPEINSIKQQIRPDGNVTLPLVGDIFVADCTLQEIAEKVAWAARRYYNRVRLTVYVEQYNSQKIYVWGEVSRPGPLPWTGSDTLLDVLAKVQPTRLAWPEKIKVIRAKQPTKGGYVPPSKEQLQNSQTQNKFGAEHLTINLLAMIKSGDMSHNVLLRPDDVIYVPPNPFAEVGLAVQTILLPLQPVVKTVQVPGDIDDATDNMRDITKD
jgi:polysaccharide export outer membrane protein